jgi:ABC-type nickel/cobalt efflux system permease component RcnA
MRRGGARAVGVAAFAGLLLALAPTASAHPLGNFSINHLVQVRAASDGLHLHYVLDQAEIPTFQERGRSNADVLAAKRAEVARRLTVTFDGRPAPLRLAGPGTLSHPPGQGGLPLTRVELELAAPAPRTSRVQVHDGTFPDRVGWKAIVAHPGAGTAVRSSVPARDPTGGRRRYPRDALSSPLDQRDGTFEVRPGSGTLVAPGGGGHVRTSTDRSGDGFAGVFAHAAAGQGVLVFLLLAAFAWGAIHALSPGHGKAMVAAYLVGTRGTARHAVGLGAAVTVTHTIGVFALGVVTLALSQYVLPEDLYPWLNLLSGVMVMGIGALVLRARVRKARARDSHHHHHHHGPEDLSWKGLVGMGASAGIVPCPSALVVLLGAIAQHQVALGLLLIVVFSLGLAATLTGLGLAVVGAGRLASRVHVPPAVATTLPAVSALAIVAAGLALTVRAVGGV